MVDNGNDFAGTPFLQSVRQEARRTLGIRSGEFMFLFVGQHIWEKNLGFLLDSLVRLSDIPFRMYFVGSGYASHELKQKVVELGLASKVSFVGSIVEREILKRYYVAADLFLFPSLYDNAPLVIREAACIGHSFGIDQGFYRFGNNLRFGKWFLSPNSTEAYSNRIREILCSTAIIKQVGEEHHELLPGHGKTWPVKCTIVITG